MLVVGGVRYCAEWYSVETRGCWIEPAIRGERMDVTLSALRSDVYCPQMGV